MDTQQLQTHLTALRQALLDHEGRVVREQQDWLTGAVAAALLNQDQDAMQVLRAGLVGLIPIADKYASGGPGERWRALGEVLQACADTHKPLEQVRLAESDRLSGLIIRQINRNPGITPSVLAEKLEKSRSHISNELKALYREGLINGISRGRATHLYLSGVGKDVLDSFSAMHSFHASEYVSKAATKNPKVSIHASDDEDWKSHLDFSISDRG